MAKDKNKYGQYFTIPSIAEFMVSLIDKGSGSRVLEPSCGEGVFLSILQNRGFNNLTGYEIDKSLSTEYDFVRHESFVSSSVDDKYDVVIGNPPYIRWKNLEKELKDELESSKLWNMYFNSLCDYLFIFVLKGIEQLTESGEMIFICPEYWMNTTNSKPLRDFMTTNGYITDIYHFKEAPLFEGVTSSFVIFKYVKSKSEKDIILHKYTKVGKPEYHELLDGTCFEIIHIPQFKCGERWILADSREQEELFLFEKSCSKNDSLFTDASDLHRIGDYCDIGNGMVSGMDNAFKINDVSSLSDVERNYVIKVYKAKDLVRFYSNNNSNYVFVTDDFDEEFFKENCPNFYGQLKPKECELNKRYNYGKKLPFWQFAFPRNEKLFRRSEKRIFIPCKERITTRHYFRFVEADENIFPLQDVTGIFKKKNCRESLEYLLAFLNSKNVFNWLKYNGIVKGDIVEFSEAPIASIPYRPIDWNNENEVEIHEKITNITRNIIDNKDASLFVNVENLQKKLIYEEC